MCLVPAAIQRTDDLCYAIAAAVLVLWTAGLILMTAIVISAFTAALSRAVFSWIGKHMLPVMAFRLAMVVVFVGWAIHASSIDIPREVMNC